MGACDRVKQAEWDGISRGKATVMVDLGESRGNGAGSGSGSTREAFWLPRRSGAKRYRRRQSLGRPGCVMVFVMATVIMLIWFFEVTVAPSLRTMAELEVSGLVTEILARHLRDGLQNRVSYRDLIYIEKDHNGRIVFMQANTDEVTRVEAETLLCAQQALGEIDGIKLEIPLGQVLGSSFLANMGPSIPVTLKAMGVASARVSDTFESRGINNVRHCIYIETEADVRVVIPLLSSEIKVKVAMPITEAIIAGEVPRTYLNWGIGEK